MSGGDVVSSPLSAAPPSAMPRRAPGPRGLGPSLRAMRHLRRDLLSFLCSLEAEHSGEEMTPVGFQVLGQPMLLAVHPAHVHTVLHDGDLFTRTVKYMNAFRSALGFNIITVPNEEWKPLRRRTARYFSGELLVRYADVVARVVEQHTLPVLDRWAASGEPFELFDEMLDIASIAAFRSFLGDREEETPEEVYRGLNEIFCFVRRNVFTLWLPPAWVPTRENRGFTHHRRILRRYLLERLEAHRERDTMFGDIIRAHTDAAGRTDVGKVLDETIANLIGGSETTIILMAWAFYYLVRHPRVEDRLRREASEALGAALPTLDSLRRMPYLDRVIREVLRLRSPAYVSSRRATRDTELGGVRIPGDAMVFVSQHITHRHSRVWPQPETFEPDRHLDGGPLSRPSRPGEVAWFPFGGGSFYCLGMNYAVNEAKVLVASLVRRYSFEPVDPDAFAEVGLDARLTLRPDRPLPVRVRRVSPAA